MMNDSLSFKLFFLNKKKQAQNFTKSMFALLFQRNILVRYWILVLRVCLRCFSLENQRFRFSCENIYVFLSENKIVHGAVFSRHL